MKDQELVDGINRAAADHAAAVEVANDAYTTKVADLKYQFDQEYDSEGGHTPDEEEAFKLYRDAVASVESTKNDMPDADPSVHANLDLFVNETWNAFYQLLL